MSKVNAETITQVPMTAAERKQAEKLANDICKNDRIGGTLRKQYAALVTATNQVEQQALFTVIKARHYVAEAMRAEKINEQVIEAANNALAVKGEPKQKAHFLLDNKSTAFSMRNTIKATWKRILADAGLQSTSKKAGNKNANEKGPNKPKAATRAKPASYADIKLPKSAKPADTVRQIDSMMQHLHQMLIDRQKAKALPTQIADWENAMRKAWLATKESMKA